MRTSAGYRGFHWDWRRYADRFARGRDLWWRATATEWRLRLIGCAMTGAAVDILRADLTDAQEIDRRLLADDGKLVENVRARGERGPSKSEIPRALPG